MTTREQAERAIAEGRDRGYPCGEPDCGVWECEVLEAAIAGLDAMTRLGESEGS